MARTKRTQSKSTDATASDRVKKVKPNSFAAQRTIAVLVGDHQTPFHIHADVLLANSTVIKEQVGDYDQNQELKPVTISNVTPETFDTFTKWIYAKRLPTDGVAVDELDELDDAGSDSNIARDSEDEDGLASNDDVDRLEAVNGEEGNDTSEPNASTQSIVTLERATDDTAQWDANLNREGRVFGRLVDAFVFATRYKCAAFLNAAILQLQRCVYNYEVIPCPTVVKRALDQLDLGSPLCRYLIICYGHYTDYEKMSKVRLATLPSEFLVAVLEIAFQRIDDDAPSTQEHWCQFHEHEDVSEREECENKRSSDPDVRVKKGFRRRRMGGCC